MRRNARPPTIALVLVVAALAVGLVVTLVTRGDDDGTPTPSTTTTTTTGGPISVDEASTVVWPDPAGNRRFGQPAEAAQSFAVDLVGFENPLVGSFRRGDNRSGEVEIRGRAAGPATTVAVRQLSDDSWWVLGASADDIELDDPIAGTAIDHPLRLVGRASAFEGTVQVAVFKRGSTTPLGEGFVTGAAGPQLGPFDGFVSWRNPGGGWGSVVLFTSSAENGSVEQAVAIPVGFIGGD
jgi:hypothetical protein